jgi:hypothetical protein
MYECGMCRALSVIVSECAYLHVHQHTTAHGLGWEAGTV